VLVDLAIASLPVEELAPGDADPGDEVLHRDLGLLRPPRDEVDDRVARVVGNPLAGQGSPASFFVLTSSSVTSAITESFLASFASSFSIFAWSSCSLLSSSFRCRPFASAVGTLPLA